MNISKIFFGAIACICAAGISVIACAQDYVREARWRAEIEPTILIGDVVDLDVAGRKVFSIYTESPTKSDIAAVIVHGIGVHPDHGLIGKLRTQIAEGGVSTLSIQMPVLASDVSRGEDYVPTFPDAQRRIAAAAGWLRAKGFRTLILVSHSMGSWMSNEYLGLSEVAPPFAAWACIGITGRIGSTGAFNGPILDLYGEEDLAPVLNGAWLRRIKLALHANSARVIVPKANHFLEGKEQHASDAIVAFSKRAASLSTAQP